MRFLGRLIVLGLIAFILAGVGLVGVDAWHKFQGRKGKGDALLAQSTTALIYQITKDNWTTFPIPASMTGGGPLRVITHVDLPPGTPAGPMAPDYAYTIEVELLDGAGAVLEKRNIALRARAALYRDETTGSLFKKAFYFGREDDVSGFQVSYLDKLDAKRVRFRLLDAAEEVHGVWLRYYGNEAVAEHKLRFIWERLSPVAQDRLARGNVYPADFLTAEERRNLLSNSWRPIGPTGVEGRDYFSDTLYVLGEWDGIVSVGAGMAFGGHYAAPDLHGVFPVPDPGGLMTLSISPVSMEAAEEPINLSFFWYGRGLSARERWDLVWRPGEPPPQLDLATGWLQITPSRPVILTAAMAMGPTESEEVLPGASFLRTAQTGPEKVVRFPVTHNGQAETLMRIDLSCACPDRFGETMEARVRMLGEDGNLVEERALTHQPRLSRYDRLVGDAEMAISERDQFYFRLGPEVATLEVASDEPLLVSGSNRPADLPRLIRLPEDGTITGEATASRSWYVLPPEDAASLEGEGRSVLTEVRHRPPEDDPSLLAGRFVWSDFVPVGQWRGRYVLIPRLGDLPVRRQALGSIMRTLRLGSETPLEFGATGSLSRLNPVLAYETRQGRAGHLRVSLDGKPVLNREVPAGAGEVDLGEVFTGRHRVLVSGENIGKAWISHTGADQIAMLRRQSVHLTRTMRYQVPKEAGDVLLTALYMPTGRDRLTVKVRPAGQSTPGPHPSVTLQERVFEFTEDGPRDALLLAGSGTGRRPAHQIFLTLGDDFPPGTYELTFEAANLGGYLTLYRTTPGGGEWSLEQEFRR